MCFKLAWNDHTTTTLTTSRVTTTETKGIAEEVADTVVEVKDTVEDMAEEMVINKMTEKEAAMGSTQESQKTITVRNITPHLASTLKKLQIYQYQLQFKKTFMLSMKKPPKERRKKTIKLWKTSRSSASEIISQDQ